MPATTKQHASSRPEGRRPEDLRPGCNPEGGTEERPPEAKEKEFGKDGAGRFSFYNIVPKKIKENGMAFFFLKNGRLRRSGEFRVTHNQRPDARECRHAAFF